jgi:hypothetical protein
MIERSVFLFLLFTAGAACAYGQPVSEVLARPTDTSMTINAYFEAAHTVFFQYGTVSGTYTRSTDTIAAVAGAPLVTVFRPLQPDTRYFYRTCYRRGGGAFTAGPEHSFVTQRAKGSRFCFTVEADCHLYDKKGIDAMMRVTLEAQRGDGPDFVIDLGDTFGDDHEPTTTTQSDMDKLHRDFLPFIGMVCHSAPFFFCIGNHEGESGYYFLQTPPDNIAVYGALARKKYFTNPVPGGFYSGNGDPEPYGIGLPENYYAWEWGDALCIVLDVYRGSTGSAKPGDWDWTLGERQYQWFRDVLRSHRAAYTFVFAHHVSGEGRGAADQATLFEWGGYDKKGKWGFTANRPGWELPIHQLMAQNGVQVFFQGHDHLFAQETLDGVIYQEAPMPSDSTYEIGMLANADAYRSNQVGGTGYLRVTVGPDSALVEFIRCWLPKDTSATRRNGEVAFSYTVPARLTGIDRPPAVDPVLEIGQNYPNPFSGGTSIPYRLQRGGRVRLDVFDALGRCIATPVNAWQDAGAHVARFLAEGSVGTMRTGSSAPRPLYFRLTLDQHSAGRFGIIAPTTTEPR